MRSSIYKILAILTVIVFATIANSCRKKNLDLLPHGLTEQSFFATEDDYNKAVLGIYAKLNDLWWFNAGASSSTMVPFLLPGDDITTNEGGEPFETFGSLQPSTGRIDYLYTHLYHVCSRANIVLQKIAGDTGVYTTPDLKNWHKGEALFLRGYAHYNLWNFYGTAPIDSMRTDSTSQFFRPGSTGTQLLDQAIKDFTAAADLLPANWDAANIGRATKNSANGMLGKSLVFRGSANKSTADFAAAITAINKITGASLVAKFDDNFAFDTENNAESLFEYQASQPFGGDNVWLSNDFDNAIGNLSIYWGYYDNNFALFGKSRFFGTTKLLNAFNAADPRRDLTINPANRQVRKYVQRNALSQSGVGSVNNYRILRYADVLLLKAEAVLQSGGSTAEAIGYINQVRTRARAAGTEPANFSTAQTDKTIIMNWIIDERLRELAGEGQRWFDLRRWSLQGIVTLDNAYFSSNTSSMSFQLPKHLNFPIPNAERDANPNVPQNTGY
jgi:tetratricopeptide (TPR) repeat protein